MLFVIALEPLLVAIRTNPDIRGVKVGEREFKVAAYADNLLLYMSNPRITIPVILDELTRYGKLTNFKINVSKSELLNITISREE